MKKRSSLYWIQLGLVVFCFQVSACPVFFSTAAASTQKELQYNKQHSNVQLLTSLFEKTENEGEGRDKFFAAEIFDFSAAHINRVSASQEILLPETISPHLPELSLFDFLCTYRI